MPAVFDRCVKGLMADPKFKPKTKGQSKKDAAYAVCTSKFKKKYGKNPQEASTAGMANTILEHEIMVELVRKSYGKNS